MENTEKKNIESFWENKDSLDLNDKLLKESVNNVLNELDIGKLRVCEK